MTSFTQKIRPTTTTTISSSSSPDPSHTSSSPPPTYTTDDLKAAKYTRISQLTLLARLAVALTSLILGAAITGTAGDSLSTYHSSASEHEWLLPMWPAAIDLRPTHAILACGVIVMVLSLVYSIFALIPMRNRLHTLNLLSTSTSLLTILTTLFTTIYTSTIISAYATSPPTIPQAGPPPMDPTTNITTSSPIAALYPLPVTASLLSWTCQWQDHDAIAPPNFGRICNEGSAGLDMVVAVVVLSVVGVVGGAVGWWCEIGLRRLGWGGGERRGGGKGGVELVERA